MTRPSLHVYMDPQDLDALDTHITRHGVTRAGFLAALARNIHHPTVNLDALALEAQTIDTTRRKRKRTP